MYACLCFCLPLVLILIAAGALVEVVSAAGDLLFETHAIVSLRATVSFALSVSLNTLSISFFFWYSLLLLLTILDHH